MDLCFECRLVIKRFSLVLILTNFADHDFSTNFLHSTNVSTLVSCRKIHFKKSRPAEIILTSVRERNCLLNFPFHIHTLNYIHSKQTYINSYIEVGNQDSV